MNRERALFLVDGSNFYYALQAAGISKGHLDYLRLAQKLAMDREIVGVRFFICPVWPSTSQEARKQQRFFSRLRLSGVTLRLGVLVSRERKCPVCGAIEEYRQEKGVDVLVAMEMLAGAIEDKYDVVYLFSCDADFAPIANYVRTKGKKVFLVAPKGSKYGSLLRACNVAIPLDQKIIDECQAE